MTSVFSWFQTFVLPFIVAFKGRFWHDTVIMVIPPTEEPIDVSYVPDEYTKSLIIGLSFGIPRVYDVETGEIGGEVITPNAGIYHKNEPWMEMHWDPFVESILMMRPYPQLGFSSKKKPYILRIINQTGQYLWTEVTFWVVKFPVKIEYPTHETAFDPEELFYMYMRSIVDYFLKLYYPLEKKRGESE